MRDRVQSSIVRGSVLGLVVLGAAACGGGGGPPGTLSGAFHDQFQRECQKAFDCKSSYLPAMHQNSASFEDFVGGTNVSGCVNTFQTFFQGTFGQGFFMQLDASVSAGRIKYNSTDYETCANAGDMETCDQIFDQNGATAMLPMACRTFFAGEVATSGACTLDFDCSVSTDGCDATSHTCTGVADGPAPRISASLRLSGNLGLRLR
jgi:hypothetical protein